MKKSLFTRIAKASLVFILICTMLIGGNTFLPQLFTDAAQSPVTYISDVQVFQSGTLDECISLCESVGYIPYRQNLNDGAIEKVSFGFDKDAPCVMLGYKTTTNRDLAVTDLSVLQMGTGYQLQDYQTIAASLLKKNQGLAEGMAAAASEFADNYEKGAPAAKRAYQMMDLMYVDDLDKHTFAGFVISEDNTAPYAELIRSSTYLTKLLEEFDKTHMVDYDWSEHVPLGDFILSGEADVEFFSKLLAFGTPLIISSVNSALCAGSAEYENYYNDETGAYETRPWADRVRDSDVLRLISEGLTTDEWMSMDSLYMDASRKLASQLQTFTTLYLNAKARCGDEIILPEADGEETIEDVADSTGDLKDADLDGMYIAAFRILNEYQYDDNTLLGDWIIRMGQKTYSSENDYRALYALADVISPSQLVSIQYCGFLTFVNCMLQCEDAGDETDELYEELVDSLKTISQGQDEYRVSVWLGVDSSIYRGKVAMTTDAIRAAVANKELQRTSSEKWEETKSLITKVVAIGTGALSLVSIVGQAAIYIKGITLAKAGIAASVASCSGFWSGLTSLTSVLGTITTVILVIEIVVAIGVFLYNKISEELHVPSSDYTEMPTIVYESKTTSRGNLITKYNAVWEPYRGRVADLNAYEGTKWNCLYLSHDEAAGSPLILDSDGVCFTFKQNDSVTPAGFYPCHVFGQVSAGNLNDYAYDLDEDEHNYLFYRTEQSAASASPDTGASSDSGTGKQLYIADLYLATADTDPRARAKITTKEGGYYLFDQNLGTDSEPAYIGYTLTDQKSKAITDIRVVAKESENTITLGGAQYGCIGSMPNGDGIYISHSDLVGTPIRSELMRVDKPEDIPAGWEPVVYVSGAPVYRFGDTSKFVLYFEPEVKYTGSEEYLGGIWFFSGLGEYEDNDTVDYADKYNYSAEYDSFRDYWSWQRGGIADSWEMGRTDGKDNVYNPESDYTFNADFSDARNLAANLLGGNVDKSSINTTIDFVTHNRYLVYMGYTVTANPYRAIHDIALYTSSSVNDLKLMANYIKGKTIIRNGVEKTVTAGFVPCEPVLSDSIQKADIADATRGLHAFKSTELGGDSPEIADKEVAVPDVGFDISWDYSPLLLQGLYVAGPTNDTAPLRLSDVILSEKAVDSVNTDGEIGAVMTEYMSSLDGVSREGEIYRSVQDLKFPYHLKAQNLAYPAAGSAHGEPDALYIYLKGSIRKPTYIASVTVGSYFQEAYKQSNPKDSDKNTLAVLAKLADETAWRMTMASSNAEIIPASLAIKQADAWYHKSNTKATDAAYIGVTRTDDPDKAITGLLLVKRSALGVPEGTNAVPGNIVVGGNTTYYITDGSAPVTMNGEDYFLYYSHNRSATPGSPITGLSIDESPLIKGASTALIADKKGSDAAPYGDGNMDNYIHCTYNGGNGLYINKLYVGAGKTYKAALADLLTQGCSEGCITDISRGAGNGSTVIGYRTFSVEENAKSMHQKKIGTAADPLTEAIRDVIFTVGEKPQDEIIFNKVVYRLVGKKNLNSGESRMPVYMYACMDYYTVYYNQKNKDAALPVPSMYSAYASPITKLGLAPGDRVPYNTTLDGMNAAGGDNTVIRWENALTDKNQRIDLNYLTIKTDATKMHIEDSRVYLFLHREDNSVKPGAEITGGFLTDTEIAGKLYGKNE